MALLVVASPSRTVGLFRGESARAEFAHPAPSQAVAGRVGRSTRLIWHAHPFSHSLTYAPTAPLQAFLPAAAHGLSSSGITLQQSACRCCGRATKSMGIFRLAELSFTALGALDRLKTVVLFTVSPLEEHGPHLPVGVDLFTAESFNEELADHICKLHPEWTVLIGPSLPIGASAFDTP